MPLTEDELIALQSFPQQSLTEVPRATVSAINDEVIKRLYGLPYDTASYAGQVAAVRADGSTLDVAGRNAGPLGFGRAELWQYEPHGIPITTNTNITAAAHQGALLICSNIGAITLTFAISGDPLSGIADKFVCHVWRQRSSGAVQIARGGSITNGHPNDHTRVSAGRMALLLLGGTELGFFGGTEA